MVLATIPWAGPPSLIRFHSTDNKKVLLCECKRHTARHVVSTPSVVLTGYPSCPDLAGGVPCWGAPYLGTSHPDLAGYPPLDLAGYPPPRCLPHGILGNVAKHYGIQVPPRCLLHGILGNVAKHYGIWVPPCGQTEGQTRVKTLPSRRTTCAGGNNNFLMWDSKFLTQLLLQSYVCGPSNSIR